MAVRYYDEAIAKKIESAIVNDTLKIHILRPDETRHFFQMTADKKNDTEIAFPMIAISRDPDLELNQRTNRPLSYDGKKLDKTLEKSAQLNAINIYIAYQLDIYAKRQIEADAILRELLFYLVNNPTFRIIIPYNDHNIDHVANIKLMSTISDTSDIAERLYKDEFTRLTIRFEIQDAYLFSIPYNKNWKIIAEDVDILPEDQNKDM